MKIKKPSSAVLLGSLLISSICFILASILQYILMLPWYLPILFSVTIALLSFIILRLLITNLIIHRLNLLIKNVYSSSKENELIQTGKSTNSLIDDIEMEMEKWENEKVKEIDKLKEQEAFRREFLGNLSHELKTPIFSIQGYILTLLEGGLEDQAVNKLFLERASKATERMVSIVGDLDQITKIESENFKLEIRSFDIVELIREIFESLDLKAGEKKTSLFLEKDYNAIIVDADRNKIAQVLTNLIGNSIFYGNTNGTTVISISSIDDLVLISVQDDGIGIEEIHLNRLFERFYRVEKSRNRNEGGSGLGLAIVKHLLEAHGQSITVKSEVGKGSVFSFSLSKSKNSSPGLYSSRGVQLK
jgi:two-component system phosphate regulon sensor histidine kinase PhoR